MVREGIKINHRNCGVNWRNVGRNQGYNCTGARSVYIRRNVHFVQDNG